MVVTRRNANTEPAQLAALERSAGITISPPELPPVTRQKRARRAAASVQVESKTRSVTEIANTSREVTTTSRAATFTTPTTATTTTTTSRVSVSAPTAAIPTTGTKRRTRSTKAETASPLRALPQQPERVTQKRKRVTKKTASETPEPEPTPVRHQPEPVQDENSDDQGIFFSKSEPKISSPSSSLLKVISEDEVDTLRNENFQLRARIDQLEDDNARLITENDSLQLKLMTGQVSANHRYSDFDMYGAMEPITPPPSQPEFVQGSESALALLHKVEEAARQSADVVVPSPPSTQEREEQPISDTPEESQVTPQPISTPSGFFSRSFSALKSTFGFSSSTPQQPYSPTPSRALPPPNTFTETLSVPPTPVGERVKTPSKKKKRNPMIKALTRGVQPEEMAKAEKWARQVAADLKNDSSSGDKRKRLETPVLYKELNYYPSSKPWETGFGDPLGDMDLDDDDVVPTWAVYADMKAEEEEHRAKKHKASHQVTIEDDDIVSLDEAHAANTGVPSPQKLMDTRGRSASLSDFHPRRSTEPSPMFKTPVSHQEGGNVFDELRGLDAAAQGYTNDLESLQRATKTAVQDPVHKPVHNPSQGSFSVPDYDSDEDDTTMNSETPNADAEPIWTQPPPPAPVPAHAPLPGAAVEPPSSPTTSQPVGEIERQRQRLMKHTPAKPSRLREATYPSPSLMSDAGNESIMAATPIQVVELFAGMPGAEPLDLDDDILEAAEAFAATEEFQKQLAATRWSSPILTYESDEEDMSSE
ncbi:hypothetical protein P153DRAFT_353096 [Dothidotthia symphoricarpi CBS 119687]|uniref:Uncharacterized protein n=1 Tax=Dothidotthia symphoricarpi CBS 119687 TaxID=1392245 RepID=A0A6A6ATI9_9PLEO|nr:uncharacterized protein P153DRAFT_353096 [Dothidotthia symphoricarpi CBS 119687]KAF2133861.1 hypothetical protein P153DRAFT_353096 [Dothidotthia symphoricarpi CBS 119687]